MANDLTPARLAAMKERIAKATKGPWRALVLCRDLEDLHAGYLALQQENERLTKALRLIAGLDGDMHHVSGDRERDWLTVRDVAAGALLPEVPR